MDDWQSKTIGDLVMLQRGIDLPDQSRVAGEIPIMGSFGITGRHNVAACKGPGVTVGRSGASAGTVSYIEGDYWPLNTCLYVRDFKGNNPRFAYYFLKTFDLAGLNSGSAQPSLNRNFVHPVPARFPEPPEQEAIAAVLSALDDKIELNRRMSVTLDAIARALFRDWLVDFGPTRAKAEGRPAYLSPAHWSLFPGRLDDDGKPEGWEMRPVDDFAQLKGGKQLDKGQISKEGSVPVFGGAGVMGFTEDHNADGYVISVGRVGAYCGRFFAHRGRAWINNNASYIRVLDNRYGEWIFLALSHLDMDLIKRGAAQPFVSNGDIASMLLMWPGDEIIEALSGLVIPIMLRIEASAAESHTLAETRDLLLPKLMSGAIRVGDAEKLAGDRL